MGGQTAASLEKTTLMNIKNKQEKGCFSRRGGGGEEGWGVRVYVWGGGLCVAGFEE